MTKKKTIYLDHASATPVDNSVLASMNKYFIDEFYNPSAIYLAAKQVKTDIDHARRLVAGQLGARPSEIIFTAGGTEANNLAIKGLMDTQPKSNMVITAIEHDSVIEPAKQFNHSVVSVDQKGIIDINTLERLIDDDTLLVSVILANNEIGTIQPIKEVSAIINQARKARLKKGNKQPIYLHSDACQAASLLDLHVSRLGVDLMTINGGKIYGPKQSGVLYVRSGTDIKALIDGGGQEFGLRSGTENVPGIIGFAGSLELVQSRRRQESERLARLQKLFISEISANFPEAYINGHLTKRLVNNIHVTFPGQDNERLVMALDEAGIICAVGSACSASKDKPSHVLEAIGLSEADARSSLRFSLGYLNTEKDIKTTIQILKKLIT